MPLHLVAPLRSVVGRFTLPVIQVANRLNVQVPGTRSANVTELTILTTVFDVSVNSTLGHPLVLPLPPFFQRLTTRIVALVKKRSKNIWPSTPMCKRAAR